MKHVETTSPEDYFRYVCTDNVAKEMFEQYCLAKEDEIECLAQEINEQSRDRILMLEEEVAELECYVEELEDQIRGLVEERDQLEYELNELEK